jgi:hypothetical protein
MAKGDPADLTWQLITAALRRAQDRATAQGYSWNGASCFYVSGLALGLVMDTRNGHPIWIGGDKFKGDRQPVLQVANRKCPELAYADHYFHTRMVAGLFGAGGGVANAAATYGYDGYKEALLWLKGLRQPVPDLLPTGQPWDVMGQMPDAARLGLFIRAAVGNVLADVGDRWEMSRRENPNQAMSLPTAEGRYWAMQGNSDGMNDNTINPMQIPNLMAL